VYNPDTGALDATLTGHTSAITTVAFFPEGNRLASAGGDRVIRIWDVSTKKAASELSGHTSVILALAISPDGKSIVSGAADRTARGWDATSGKAIWKWTGQSVVTAVGIHPGGKEVAIGLASGKVVLLDVSAPGTVREVATIPAHVAGVAGVSFSPDGSKLATVGGDGAVQVWMLPDTSQPTQLVAFEGQPKNGGFSPLSAVAFAPDGRFVVSAGADAIVRIWDVHTKAEVRGLRGHTDWVTAVAFSPDGRFLVSGSVDKTARVYELIPQEGAVSGGHQKSIHAVAVSFDGKTVATASTDNTVRLWDLASGKEVGALLGSNSNDIPAAVTFLGANAVVLGNIQGPVAGRIYFWTTAAPRTMTTVATGQVYTVAGAPDGSRVAVWSTRPLDRDQTQKLSTYEIFDRDAKPIKSITDKDRQVSSVVFTPDLTWATAGDSTGAVQIWDLDTKAPIGGLWSLFGKGPIVDLGVTSDKKYLVAVDGEGLIKVADVAKRETLGTATHKGEVSGLLVSPKGDTFLTIGTNREIKVWSLADPKAIKESRSWAFPVEVKGAAYTPDGKSVVTANADGTAYILELP
jgi:WD40 repeat protein